MSSSEDSDGEISEDESFSDDDFEDLFGESDEEDFEGFQFQLPQNLQWEKDADGSLSQEYY